MTDYGLTANPRNRTSLVSEMGIVVYNGVQDEAEIQLRAGKLGSSRKEEVAKNFPGDLLFTRANRRHAAVSANNPLPMQGALPVWSAFNGAEDEDESEFVFAGEARTTNQLQGMAGRELGRSLAIKNAGLSTIRNVSVSAFAPGTFLTWCVPRSSGLPGDLTGNNRRLAELKAYKATDHAMSRQRLHELIKRSMAVGVNADALNNGENVELSHALFMAKGLRAVALAANLAVGAARNPSAVTPDIIMDAARAWGIVDYPDNEVDVDTKRADSRSLFDTFLDIALQAAYDPKTQRSKTDPKRAPFPDASLVVGRMRTAGNESQKRVNRAMLEGVENILTSEAALADVGKQRIFCVTLSAANPGQDMDVLYTRK